MLKPAWPIRVQKHQIPAHGLIPNTSIQHKPLLIYRSAFPAGTSVSAIEAHLGSVGVVSPAWRYPMYEFTHFHSTSHEVLCVYAGRARLCFGGEDNDGRVEEEVGAGDVVVVPAGVGHRMLQEVQKGFMMVGSYPQGYSWDMCHGKAGEEEKVKAIGKLPWFERDPIYGDEGPVLDV